MSFDFTKISFITPCFNEEKNIENLIASIHSAMGDEPHEIIIVDNGSTDSSLSLARSAGAKAYIAPHATIGALRNLGVQHAEGDLLVFLDADVTLSPDWLDQLRSASNNWPKTSLIITGSKVESPPDASYLETVWFSNLKRTKNTYINSAHCITTKCAFKKVFGFSETLHSGEDHDFCQRAIKQDIKVFNDPSIQAFHHNYPKTLTQFAKREIWHGSEDFQSFRHFITSRTANAAIVNSLFFVLLVVALLFGSSIAYIAVLAIFTLSLCFIFMKLDGPYHLIHLPAQLVVIQVYLFSRTLALWHPQCLPDNKTATPET
ncbi:glycosyltransferase [Marinobacter piscensis]|uniref:glycosyltransferase n=1 Tax=Marinobacter piscensis TaxID=1562308 RepID=UPI00164317D2|nr:glycosyltransferase [Marinobacter piscensis]